MADTKITALTALTAADPINDVIPIVDVSDTSMAASGTTKKISVNNILSSSPTASGALTVTGLVTAGSATITGDLTVDTSTLKVDSTNNQVGIGTSTPGGALEVFKNTNGQNRLFLNNPSTGASAYDAIDFTAGTANNQILSMGSGYSGSFPYLTGALLLRSAQANGIVLNTAGSAAAIQFGINDTLGMTLNSTGLGVGGSPSYKLDVLGVSAATVASGAAFRAIRSSSGDRCLIVPLAAGSGFTIQSQNAAESDFTPIIFSGSTTTFNYRTGVGTVTTGMTLDASGNLLVGKTATGFGTVGNEVKANGEVFSTQASTSNVASTYHVYSTGAAAYRFYVGMGGTVFATNTTISAISDARFKENVQDIDVGLGAILALKPRKFDWKAGKGKDIKGDRGFIAQEFETVFPNLIDEWKENAPEGEAPYKSVRQDLIPVLVKAIQELAARVQTLETR